MKKVTAAFILACLICFSGCAQKEINTYSYTYEGENDSWSAVYVFDTTHIWWREDGKLQLDGDSKKEMTVTYKGDISELSAVERFKISYDALSSGGASSLDGPPKENPIIFKNEGGAANLPPDDAEITVTIEIDGTVQTIELQPVD